MKVGDKVVVVNEYVFGKHVEKGDKASIVDIEPNGMIDIFLETGLKKGEYQMFGIKDEQAFKKGKKKGHHKRGGRK